jgi:hypothetical protein
MVEGRASAILKETRAPAVVVSRQTLGPDLGSEMLIGLNQFFAGT